MRPGAAIRPVPAASPRLRLPIPRPTSRLGPTRSIGQVGAWCRARCSERIAPRAMGRPAQELLAHRREPFEWLDRRQCPARLQGRRGTTSPDQPQLRATAGPLSQSSRSSSLPPPATSSLRQVCAGWPGCGHPRLHACAARQGDGKVSTLSSSQRAYQSAARASSVGSENCDPPRGCRALGVQKGASDGALFRSRHLHAVDFDRLDERPDVVRAGTGVVLRVPP